jgi:hypothetical protein
MLLDTVVSKYNAAMDINVFAGNDRTICLNQNLLITDLAATITGDVSDGDWITLGDGKFQPGNFTSVRFKYAQANQISYVQGTNDKLLGFYQLMLITDAPVGGTPQEKKIDDVRITFQTAPPLFCASNVNVSLNETCTQKIDVTILQSNPVPPFSNYIVTLYDAANQVIPNNTLTRAHIDKEITYKLGHQCTSNICWGKFKVEDYFPPVFICKNDTIPCTKSISPDSLGFPFPVGAYIDTIINNKYIVKNWDACSDVTLEYTDEIIKANCARDEDKTITRKWKARDAKGNLSTCDEKIVVKRISLAAVLFPPHYDGHEKSAFECLDTFPVLANGHPSPDTTGSPFIGHCGNLQFNMTDVRFDLCGKGFKIARSWFVIDWCTSESVTRNQIIVVKDSRGPELMCKDMILLFAGAYQCAADRTEIPSLISIGDCSAYTVRHRLFSKDGGSADQFIVQQQQKFYFSELPAGEYMLDYEVTDVCNNTSTCSSYVIVKDNLAPNTVCDQVTKVSLDANGKGRVFAITFDDGSTDNCGVASFRVRRMIGQCGFGTQFGEFVDFCCEDIGTTQMVALEVTDIHGNKNTCMIEVLVEDKLKPSITCPPNITLACTDNYDFDHLDIFGSVVTKVADVKDVKVFNYYHNGLVGKDGLAKDNCSVTVSQSYIADIDCYIGTIRRKFVATDASGLKDSCIQTITILNPDPFDQYDISWPATFDTTGCRYDQTDPSVTGRPIFKNTSCATVAATYEDNNFYIADGACLKIIRTWTVVDWCQYTGSNSIGKWGPYVQIIKLHNTDKPEFNTVCRDTSFCSYDPSCQTGWVNLKQSATDPCTAAADLVWRYELDLFINGTVDSVGQTNDFVGNLPLGKHKISWRVEDQCGNYNTCSHTFTISDCKNPTPYCKSSLTLPLMQSKGTIEIWARDFDNGSSDNCTSKENLWFTFNGDMPVKSLIDRRHYFKSNGILSDSLAYISGDAQVWIPETKSSGLFFSCSDIQDGKSAIIPLQMTITDQAGNKDFCTVELVLQDNANSCPDMITDAKVSGRILTQNNVIPKNTKVTFGGSEWMDSRWINNADGKFILDSLPLNSDYTITPYLNSDPLEGVSTIDLVLIQRHILGISPFDSPYKLIAADVNSSKSVTAADLVELRKLILGITDKYPKGLPSWVFVDKNETFENPQQPYLYENSRSTGVLTHDLENVDFIAVKMGDVNQSVSNISNSQIENRSEQIKPYAVMLGMENWDNRNFLTYRASEYIQLDGLQIFTTLADAASKVSSRDVKVAHAHLFDKEIFIDESHIRFLQYSVAPGNFFKGDLIHAFEIDSPIDLFDIKQDINRKSEIFGQGQSIPVSLQIGSGIITTKSQVRLQTNPVVSNLNLIIDGNNNSQEIRYRITNMSGQEILSSSSDVNGDHSNDFSIALPDHTPPGIYFIHLKSDLIDETIRFISVR